MKAKNMYKIGLSLLIALAFILPSGGFMASSIGKQDADDTRDITEPRLPGIYSQAFPVMFGGLEGENGDGKLFDIVEDAVLPLDCYDLWLTLLKPDDLPAVGKPHIEIYELTEGLEVIMYETSFEDNFDIYNNWIQVDQDCGLVGGHYDSWSWSDARASDGDHSFKSTMYDIYKGNQVDYLVCRTEFDVCDQFAVVVSFDVWAEGDYDDSADGTLDPYDFASFEIGDGSTWIENLTLDEEFGNEYKFFDTTLPLYNTRLGINVTANVEDIGNGWWHVTYRANMSELAAMGLDCSQLQFRFDWHSDPQFQYEGAYIDNFKVISIESEMEKIYQGHSQGPIDILRHNDLFKYPLEWCPEEGCYRARVWLEVLDIDHESDFDWPDYLDIDFCVGDDIDCEITDLYVEDSFTEEIVEDGGIMLEGSDAHIVFTYHNGGNIPMENVAITATANKLSWDTIFETDYEVSLSPWPLEGEVHLTDLDSYSGSKSLGWFDKDTVEYPTDAFWNTYSSEISLEGVEEMYMDYYWIANTDPGDFVVPATKDDRTNTVLGSGYGTDAAHYTAMEGYEPDWIGPTENVGKYVRLDVLALYDWYLDAGYLRDSYGVPDTEIALGFFMTTDGDSENRHPDAIDDGVYWSGVLIDDVSITQKAIGEEVWTDTIIIPGPIEPCETYEAQFEWEDVPFSNYQICVEAECEGDIDPDDNINCTQILVLDNLEHMTIKNLETIDYTGECDEGWGICTSDYDNYLSTNPEYHYYASNSGAIVQLCVDGEDCINLSGVSLPDPDPVYTVYVDEQFDTDLGGMTQTGAEWFWAAGDAAGGAAAGQAAVNSGSIVDPTASIYTPTFDASGEDTVDLSFTWASDWLSGTYYFRVRQYDGSTWTNAYSSGAITADVAATPVSVSIPTNIEQLMFQVYSHTAGEMQWLVFDDVLVEGTYTAPAAPDSVYLEFDAWWEIETDWDFVNISIAECDPMFNSDWTTILTFTNTSFDNATYIADDDGWVHFNILLDSYITADNFTLRFRLDSDANTEGRGFMVDNLAVNMSDTYSYLVLFGPDPMDNMSNWCVGCYALGDFWDDFCIDIPDLLIDNALIWDTEIKDAYEAYLIVNHSYEFSNIIPIWEDDFGINWTVSGNWTETTTTGTTPWKTYYTMFSHGPPFPIVYWNDGSPVGPTWDTTIASMGLDCTSIPTGLDCQVRVGYNYGYGGNTPDGYMVYAVSHDLGGTEDGRILLFDAFAELGAWSDFSGLQTYRFDPYALGSPDNVSIEFFCGWDSSANADLIMFSYVAVLGATVPATGYIELSDDGGANWHILDTFIGKSDNLCPVGSEDTYDISAWAGSDILVRFRVEGSEDSVDDRWWCLCDVSIAGKTDETAPTSTATMSGTMKESGWYTTGVQVAITATDNVGMGEIHYILDGTENVVAGDHASFTVSGNGNHNIEFWAVDSMGNVETPHHIIPTFRIDSGSPPSVAITAPEPGLYLFGNKLLSASKVIIIGAFTVEATASDAESGIYRVQFFLDGDLISEDTEVPFSAYVAEKHMGAGTIKVVAEDFAQNTAEDTLDITYYKFL